MSNRVLSTIFLLFGLVSLMAQPGYKYSKIKFDLEHVDIHDLAALGLETDHGHHSKHKCFTNIFSNFELEKLDELGIEYQVVIEDIQAFYRQYGTMDETALSINERSANCEQTEEEPYSAYETPENYEYGTMGGYLTYDEAIIELDKMKELYPELITERLQIGDILTHQGNNLYYMVISPDVVNEIDTLKPQIIYTALHHAREPNSLSQLIFYMWYLLENYGTDEEVTYLMDNTTMFFMPIVNPDGYILNGEMDPTGGGLWRKNVQYDENGELFGVDLNRNYGFNWAWDDDGSSPDPGSQTYRGTGPFSEPETQAVRELFNANKFEISLNYHTSGDLLIHPWGYSDQPTDEDNVFKSLGRLMIAENDFVLGTGTETVGYVVNGDSDDWQYGETEEKIPAYAMTPEVGPSFWPGQDVIDELNKSCMRLNLNAAHTLLNFGWAKEIMAEPILSAKEGKLFFEFEKSGLRQGPIHFSVVSNTEGVTLEDNEFPDLDMEIGQTREFEVDYFIDEEFNGETIEFDLVIDNGIYQHKIPFTKSFDAVLADGNSILISDGNNSEIFSFENNWGPTSEDFFSSPNSLTDSPFDNYENNLWSGVAMNLINPFSLVDAETAHLTFQTKFEIEQGWDLVQVRASTDGINFEALCGSLTDEGSEEQNAISDGPVYDGFVTEWSSESICLEDYLGEEEVYIQFILFSDGFVTEDGFYLDDLALRLTGDLVGNEKLDLDYFKVQPNPATDQIRLHLSYDQIRFNYQFELIDVMGQMVENGTIERPQQTIQTAHLSSGAYFIRLKKDGRVVNQYKFIKH